MGWQGCRQQPRGGSHERRSGPAPVIAKITRGSRPGDLAAYLHGPGRHNEHSIDRVSGGRVIAGNRPRIGDRNGAKWAADLRLAASQRPDINKPIWHMSLRAAPDDRSLSDIEWADIAQDMLERLGAADRPWVAIRHGDDHIHIALCRVGYDGSIWHAKHDYAAAQRARRPIEQRLGLTQTPTRALDSASRGTKATRRLRQGEYQHAAATGVAPARVEVSQRVQQAVVRAAGQGRAAFEAQLDALQIDWQVNIASTGRVSGYSFRRPGHLDSGGGPVWWKASQLDRRLAWRNLQGLLDGREPVPFEPIGVAAVRDHWRGLSDPSTTAQKAGEAKEADERSQYARMFPYPPGVRGPSASHPRASYRPAAATEHGRGLER